jgi:putative transposase
MQLSETVKLYMSKTEYALVKVTMDSYISTVNSIVSDAVNGTSIAKLTTKNVNADLPSALTNQCIRDAKSIVKKYDKACRDADRKNAKLAKQCRNIKVIATRPVLKKPCCYINNQNFKVNGNNIEFPVMINGKSKRLSIRTKMTDRQKSIFATSKLGNMRRHFAAKRKALQKAKHQDAVEHINNKEQHIMKDIDHKLSHDIVATAIAHNVKTIKLEQLQNIRSTTRTSRKNNHSLHNWSFYRLAQYITYKAKLAGIEVLYVNPAYTSQRCPVCGDVHHANDRDYVCKCGYHIHRDVLGAINICNSTEYVGDSNIRRTA